MNSIFSQIFEALDSAGTMAKCADLNEEYCRLSDAEDEFESKLSPEMREKFLEIITLRGSSEHERGKQLFIDGVRIGMQLMLDAMLERERNR